jgi:hypothetical protein
VVAAPANLPATPRTAEVAIEKSSNLQHTQCTRHSEKSAAHGCGGENVHCVSRGLRRARGGH